MSDYLKALQRVIDDLESGNLAGIEDAIAYFRRRLANITAIENRRSASAAPAEGRETSNEQAAFAEIPEGWMLVLRERIEEIEACMRPDLAEDYRGCGLYDDDATRANFNACNRALEDIRSAVESIRNDFAPVLLPARAALATAPTMSEAVRDVLAERRRVVEQEGFTPQHDDQWIGDEIALAAIVYAESAVGYHTECPDTWPWSATWFKPTTPRSDLIKAAQLIIAEIERIDRAAIEPKQQ